MNGDQARLLLDGAFAFTEHIPMNIKDHRKRENAYTVLKDIINMAYKEDYPTMFEEHTHPEEWTSYKNRGEEE